MRWHVHGTDSLTNSDVEFVIEETDSARAIKAAIDRHIVVSHVASGTPGIWKRLSLPLLVALALAFAGSATWLYAQNFDLRAKLDRAKDGQETLARSAAQAGIEASESRKEGKAAGAEEARKRAQEQEATAAKLRAQVAALETSARANPELQQQIKSITALLKESEAQNARLRTEMTLKELRLADLERLATLPPPPPPPNPELATLRKTNQDLMAQIESLKKELLIAAAKASGSGTSDDEPPAPVVAGKWALAVGFQSAHDFLILHSDRDSVRTIGGNRTDEAVTDSGALTDNAATIRIVRDREKQRVYSASLTISLASDAPKERLAENKKLVAEFLKAFASTMRNPDAFVTSTQLAGLDPSKRLLFLGEDYKLTLWNNREGLCTFRIESPRSEIE